MQEEQANNQTETKVETPSPAVPAASTSSKSTLIKDFSIPLSIVVAGVCVGMGLYFGGSGGNSGGAINLGGSAPVNQQQQAAVDPSVLIPQLVDKAGVDRDDFIECFENESTAAAVQEDADNAMETGGRGTPWSIVIGPGGKTFPVNGAVPAATVQQVIELARSGAATEAGDTDKVTPVTEADHIKGSLDAPIKVVEYSDFDCPFCSRFHGSMETIIESNDDVAWVYRHFPLDSLHPQARAVARASECVAELGGNEAFWIFTDGYFAAK